MISLEVDASEREDVVFHPKVEKQIRKNPRTIKLHDYWNGIELLAYVDPVVLISYLRENEINADCCKNVYFVLYITMKWIPP